MFNVRKREKRMFKLIGSIFYVRVFVCVITLCIRVQVFPLNRFNDHDYDCCCSNVHAIGKYQIYKKNVFIKRQGEKKYVEANREEDSGAEKIEEPNKDVD